ncbi:hypothetical protein [Oleiharenicola sp. Vm1]|uniref:hypothetical protein n=1 Tax=Oleiharenicola sp. Vm1 TaxID=3398393 RepID=UPI0039F513A3
MRATLHCFGLIVRHDLRLVWRGWLGRFGDTFLNAGLLITLFVLLQVLFGVVLTLVPRATLAAEAGAWAFVAVFIFSNALTNIQLARPDGPLLFSSPVSAKAVLAARVASQTLASISGALFFVLPAVNVYAIRFGPGYLAGYLVLLLLGLAGATAAMAATLALTRLLGARRAVNVIRVAGFVLVALFIVALRLPEYRHSPVIARLTDFLGELATGGAMRGVACAGQGQPLPFATLLVTGLLATGGMTALLGRTFLSGAQQEQNEKRARPSPRPHRWVGSLPRVLYAKELRVLAREPVAFAQLLPTLANLLPLLLMFRNLGWAMLAPLSCALAQVLVLALTPLVAGGDEAWDLLRGSPVPELTARRVKLAAALTPPLAVSALMNLALAALGHPLLALVAFVAALPGALSCGWLLAARIAPTAKSGLVKGAKHQANVGQTFLGFALIGLASGGLWALVAGKPLLGAGLIGGNWLAALLIFGFTSLRETPDWKFEALRSAAPASK